MSEKEKLPDEKIEDTIKESMEPEEESNKETKKEPAAPEVTEGKSEFLKKKEKHGKTPPRSDSEKPVKKIEDKDFNYIVRVANTDIKGENSVVQGLTQIKGIGRHIAIFITDAAGLDRRQKFGKLSEPQIVKIKEVLEQLNTLIPAWMLNRRRDYYTGENYHLISTEVDSRLRDDINLMKMIRSYRGVRHESGLKVRGQRTSSNGRRGLALGVSKRREPATAAKDSEEKKKE